MLVPHEAKVSSEQKIMYGLLQLLKGDRKGLSLFSIIGPTLLDYYLQDPVRTGEKHCPSSDRLPLSRLVHKLKGKTSWTLSWLISAVR